MAKNAVSDWSEAVASNTDIGGNSLDDDVQTVDALDTIFAEFMSQIASFTGGDSIASAATTDLSTVEGQCVTITGTTTITAFGTAKDGWLKFVTFSGALTVTHNATSLILPGEANIITAAGDTMILRSLGSGNWRCLTYSPAGKGGWEHIETLTASSSSSLDFEGLNAIGYSKFMFVLTRVLPATDGAVLYGRVGTGGTPTYQTSSYFYAGSQVDYSGNPLYLGSGAGGAAQITLTRDGIGNQSDEFYSGTIFISDIGAAAIARWDISGAHLDTTGVTKKVDVGGHWNSTTAITAIRFIPSSGNIASGSISVYGMR